MSIWAQIRMLLTVVLTASLLGCDNSAPAAMEPERSPGCEEGDLTIGTTHLELDVDGTPRSFEVYVPAGYDGTKPMPLVLNFHGVNGDGEGHAASTDMTGTADERGFIAAFPNGIDKSWNGGGCCGGAFAEQVDDVGFTRELIEHVGQRACIDTKRVYATGFSNGAVMTHFLACEAADVLAAVSPVSGFLAIDPSDCNPARNIPLILLHGTEDRLAPHELGLAAFQDWLDKNQCTGEPTVTNLPSGTCETYDDCAGGVTVAFCSIEQHDHCWPAPHACLWDETPTDFPGNDVMMDFFEQTSLP
jgi:polyhydroxybutyrate depolymerase